jgi:ribosomal-protein-alanine N-acetyltransferase
MVHYSDDSYGEFLKLPQFKTYGFVEQNELLGFVILTVNQDEADVVSVCVNPNYRRKGIARRLLAYSCNINKIKTLFIEVLESNSKAISFYKGIGFQQVGIRKNYLNNENAIVMRLTLLSIN